MVPKLTFMGVHFDINPPYKVGVHVTKHAIKNNVVLAGCYVYSSQRSVVEAYFRDCNNRIKNTQ